MEKPVIAAIVAIIVAAGAIAYYFFAPGQAQLGGSKPAGTIVVYVNATTSVNASASAPQPSSSVFLSAQSLSNIFGSQLTAQFPNTTSSAGNCTVTGMQQYRGNYTYSGGSTGTGASIYLCVAENATQAMNSYLSALGNSRAIGGKISNYTYEGFSYYLDDSTVPAGIYQNYLCEGYYNNVVFGCSVLEQTGARQFNITGLQMNSLVKSEIAQIKSAGVT